MLFNIGVYKAERLGDFFPIVDKISPNLDVQVNPQKFTSVTGHT
jgi:hypothetical protein